MGQVKERFVYLLRAGENHYKVGIANNVLNRLKGVQNGNPLTLKIIATVFSEDAPLIESGLHKWLAVHKAAGGREWFELTPLEAIELVARMTELTTTADITKYLAMRNLITRMAVLEKKFDNLLNMKAVAEALEKQRVEMEQKAIGDRKGKKGIAYKGDDLFDDAVEAVNRAGKASASMLQRRLRIGYARAARLLDLLEADGIISKSDGARPREILTIPTHA